MLLIFNPNPVFDRTVSVPRVAPGAVIRAHSAELTCGGKGINVARALRSLGADAMVVLPVGIRDRASYEALLAAENLAAEVIPVAGGVRTATILRESESDRVTVINEAGEFEDPAQWSDVVERVVAAAHAGDLVLVMGSLPNGLDPSALLDLVAGLHARGARVLVDTAPRWLEPVLAAHPDVITPNLDEAEACLGLANAHVMDSDTLNHSEACSRAERAARHLVERGARIAAVTAGGAGVAVATAKAHVWVPAVSVDVVSTVGAGDSFVAGFAHSWQDTGMSDDFTSIVESVRSGVASAAASCEQVLAGGVVRERYEELRARVPEAVLASGVTS
jgi:1-phosphofructokinase family hexose kinase